LSINTDAQDTNSNFVFSAGGTIYSQQSESPDYLLYPTPELEVLYKIKAFKTLSVFTGLHYTYSYSIHDLGVKSEWKRTAHELALPLFLEQTIGKFISIKGGAAIGYLIKGKEEYRNNIPANPEWVDVTYQTDYDESSGFYMVLFFDPKLKYDFDAWNTISVGPTLKYYIEDNWMEKVRNETMIGITLQYSFRI
jgi:hypothetical protein